VLTKSIFTCFVISTGKGTAKSNKKKGTKSKGAVGNKGNIGTRTGVYLDLNGVATDAKRKPSSAPSIDVTCAFDHHNDGAPKTMRLWRVLNVGGTKKVVLLQCGKKNATGTTVSGDKIPK
jgi:hypothetical protein